MLRRTPLAALAIATALLPAAAVAQEPTTTRIETRAFYGATVTLEAGVRVFRPLPPHSKVIINPGGVTPLYLGHEEHRSTSHNYNYNYDQSGAAADHGGNNSGTYYGGGFAAGRRAYNHGGPRFHAPRYAGPKHYPVHASGKLHAGSAHRGGGQPMHGGGHGGGHAGGGGGKR